MQDDIILSAKDLLKTIQKGELSPLYEIITNEEISKENYAKLTKEDLVNLLEKRDKMISEASNIICTILCHFVDTLDQMSSRFESDDEDA